MADVTLSFEDGTEHRYTGVPDDATPDAVIERAGRDFSGKTIKHIARSLTDVSPTLSNAESLPRAKPLGMIDRAKNYVMQNVVEPLATLPITGPLAGQVRDEQARRRQDINTFNESASIMRGEKPLSELDYSPAVAALGAAKRTSDEAAAKARPPLTTVEVPDYTTKDYLDNPSLALDVVKGGLSAAPGKIASKFAQGGLGIAENLNDIADATVGTGFLGGKLSEASRKERQNERRMTANLPPDAQLIAEGAAQSATTLPATIATILAKGNPATAALSLIPFGAQVYGQEYSSQGEAGKGLGEKMFRAGLATANEVGTELAGNIVGGHMAPRAPVSWKNAAARGGAAMMADQLGEHTSTYADREIARVLGDPLSNDAEYRKAQLDTLKQTIIQLGLGSAAGAVANKAVGAMTTKQDQVAAAFDQMVRDAEFQMPSDQEIAAGSVSRAPQNPGTMETDKQFAKRVIDKRAAPESLPEQHDLYFKMDGATVMPIASLDSTKSEEENQQGGDNGPKRMAAAAAGELGKRDPITVMPSETPGRFDVVDGNGTLTSVKKYGWQNMPVTVVPREQGLAMIEADHAKEASKAKAGNPVVEPNQGLGMPLEPLAQKSGLPAKQELRQHAGELRGRTLAETLARIPEETRAVSKDPARTLSGADFASIPAKEPGGGFFLYRAKGAGAGNVALNNAMAQAVSEAGLPPELAAKIKVPSAEVFDRAFALPAEVRYWYERSAEGFSRNYFALPGHETERLIDVVAASSGNKRPYDNVKDAVAALASDIQGKPVAVGFRDPTSVGKALSPNEIDTHKFGNFAGTMQMVARTRNGKPLPTIDLQMAKMYGLNQEDVSTDPRMYEAIARHVMKVRDMQNAFLQPGAQPYESWQVQALGWVDQRGTGDPDDYASAMPRVIKILNDAGIPTPGGKITMETLRDPRTPEALAPSSKMAQGTTVTFETRTTQTPTGRLSTETASQIEGRNEPWARKARMRYERIQRQAMEGLGNKRPHPAGLKTKAPSIISNLFSAIVGKTAASWDASRIDTGGYGTFMGVASPNMRIPGFLSPRGKSASDRVTLAPEQVTVAMAVLGREFKQEAMAASAFADVPLGQHDTFTAFVADYENDDAPASLLADIEKSVGWPVNYSRAPNGWVIDINKYDTKAPPLDERDTMNAITAVLGDKEFHLLPRSYNSIYIEASDYDRIIEEFENGLQGNTDAGTGKKAGNSGSRHGDFVAAIEGVRSVAAEQEAAFAEWDQETRRRLSKPSKGLPLQELNQGGGLPLREVGLNEVVPEEVQAHVKSLLDVAHPIPETKLPPEVMVKATLMLKPQVEAAHRNKPAFDKMLGELAKSVGGIALTTDVKKAGRSAVKLVEDYNFDTSKMMDLLRGTILVASEAEARAAAEQIAGRNKLARPPKDRFAKPTPEGYQDIMVNPVMPDGHVTEILIMTPEMFAAKKLAHKLYDHLRAGTEPMPWRVKANFVSKIVYGLAAQARTRAENSASDTGMPLWAADAGGKVRAFGSNAMAFSQLGDKATGTSSTSSRVQPSAANSAGVMGASSFNGSIAQGRTPMGVAELQQAANGFMTPESNLIDEKGNPLVLYHGTNKAFSSFKPSKTGLTGPGVYLGLDPEVANGYADGPGANVMPVIVRGRFIDIMAWSKYVQDNGDWKKARAAAEKDGVAGIIDRKFEYAVNVFDPKNIKSAIGNNGNYDAADRDVVHQEGGQFVYGTVPITDKGAGLISQYRPKLDERTMARRGLEPLERKQATEIDRALGDLIASGVPRSWAERATFYGLKPNNGRYANYNPTDQAIGVLSPELDSAAKGSEASQRFVRGWLAHELHHLIDNYQTSSTQMFYLSAESPRMDMLHDGESLVGRGDLAAEAIGAWSALPEDHEVRKFLNYPFVQATAMANEDERGATMFAKVELFAQMGAMYSTNPGLMEEHFPAWYEFFKEWSNARGTEQQGSFDRSRVTLRNLFQKPVSQRANQGRGRGAGYPVGPVEQNRGGAGVKDGRPGVGANAPGAGNGRGSPVLPAAPQAAQGQSALGVYRDLSRSKIPGDNHIPTHVNYSTFNSANELKKVYAGLSEKYEKEIQEQRRGTVSHKESYRDARKLIEDEAGISSKKVDSMLKREPGTPAGAAEILARMAILESETAKTQAMADKIERQGSLQTSEQEWLDFAAQLDRTAMAHQTFLGARAEIGRALNAIRGFAGMPYDGKQIQSVLDTYQGTDGLSKVATAIAQTGHQGTARGRGNAVGRLAKAASKATVTDAVIELWKAGLLSGPTTHLANLLSNALFTMMRLPEQAVAGTVGALHGGKSAHLGETAALALGMSHGVLQGFRAASRIMANEDATMGNTPTEEHQHAISGDTFGVGGKLGAVIDYLGKAVRMPFRMLSAEDAIFKMVNMYGSLYASALRTALDEGGSYWDKGFSHRVAELVKEGEQTMLDPTGAMGPSAVSEAGRKIGMESIADGLTYTFQNRLGKIGQSVEMVRNNVKATHFIIPFVRTPLNIFRQGLERTPLAPMSKQWRADVAAGGHQRDLALGRALLGTSLMAGVMAAVSSGLLTGGGDPEDFRRRRRMEAGITPYSIKINGKWVEYRRLEPLGTIIGAAADAAETSRYAQEDNAEHVMSMVAAAFAQAVTSKTYMKGLSDLVNVMAQPERYGERWYQSIAGSVVPAAVSQFAGRNDTENGRPVVRDVRSMGEGMSGLADLKQTTANAIKGRLPKTPINPEFNRESLPKRVDTWGETQTSAPGSFPGSPVRVSSPTDDPVRQEANRLGVKMTDIGTKALGVKLNAEQLETYSRSSGRLAHEVMSTLVGHPEWQNIPDFAKVKAFEEAIKAGREFGRGIITPEIINKSIEKTLKGIADVEYD